MLIALDRGDLTKLPFNNDVNPDVEPGTTADARLAEQTDKQADFVLIKPISFSLLRDLSSRLGYTKRTV